MMGINGLPPETLRNIVSYLSPDISELAKSSLVCRGLSEVAHARLYKDIDLMIGARDQETEVKTPRR
jgi:hypothetical protein